MEGTRTEQPGGAPSSGTPPPGGRRSLVIALAVGIAALVAFGAAVFVLASGLRSDDGSTAAGDGDEASGFIFFDQIHATIFVQPGVAGENDVELLVATHDGTVPEITDLTVTVADPVGGASLGEFPAEPDAAEPGTFRVSGVSIPNAGDWEFGISITVAGEDPVSDTTLIPIGAPSSAN